MPRGQTLQIPVVDETDVIKQIDVRDELHAVPDSGHIRQRVTCQCTTYKLLTTAPELNFFLIKASTIPWCALVLFASRRRRPSTSRPRPATTVRRPDQAAGWRRSSRSHEQLCHRHQEQHCGTMSRLQHLHHRPGIHHDSKTFTVLVCRPLERKSPRKESQWGDRTLDRAAADAKTTEDLSLTIDVVVKFYLCLSSSSCISAGRRWALHRITISSFDPLIYASRVSHGLIAYRVFLCASCCCLAATVCASSIILQGRSNSFRSYIHRPCKSIRGNFQCS
jgi:hypothetical protein